MILNQKLEKMTLNQDLGIGDNMILDQKWFDDWKKSGGNGLAGVDRNTLLTYLRMYHEHSLSKIQKEHIGWSLSNFGVHPAYQPLLGVGEEVGELNHAYLKAIQGIRGTPEQHHADMIDAVGDIVIYLCDFCNCMDIDLEGAVAETWAKVKKRDWKKNPESGE